MGDPSIDFGAVKVKEGRDLWGRSCDSNPADSGRADVEPEALRGSQNIISHPNIYPRSFCPFPSSKPAPPLSSQQPPMLFGVFFNLLPVSAEPQAQFRGDLLDSRAALHGKGGGSGLDRKSVV